MALCQNFYQCSYFFRIRCLLRPWLKGSVYLKIRNSLGPKHWEAYHTDMETRVIRGNLWWRFATCQGAGPAGSGGLGGKGGGGELDILRMRWRGWLMALISSTPNHLSASLPLPSWISQPINCRISTLIIIKMNLRFVPRWKPLSTDESDLSDSSRSWSWCHHASPKGKFIATRYLSPLII